MAPEQPVGEGRVPAMGGAATQAREGASRGEAAGTRVPDFFVVGHQKCGTTALYLMLKRHPQIFLPEVKEPKYLASDLYSRFAVKRESVKPLHTLEGYLELFAAATPEQLVGEASPQYLRSRVAAARIAELRPDARIVAILREPASFVRSFHMQMVASHVETEGDLRRAIALEEPRSRGTRIPRGCHHPQALQYSDHVRYVEQLRRFHAVFPREQVLVLIYDDFRKDNLATLRQVLRFLGVQEDDAPLEQVQTKPLQDIRAPSLHRLAGAVRAARRNPASAGPLARALGAVTPESLLGERVRSPWRRIVYRTPRRPDEAYMLELRRRYKPQVSAVSEYLGRDLLSEWGYDAVE
jgi:hypothetical protein